MIDHEHLQQEDLHILLRDGNAEIPESLAEHISHCPECQQRMEILAAQAQEWNRAKENLAGSLDFELEFSVDLFLDGRKAGNEFTEAIARQLLQPPSHPEMLGRLGRYEVERLIGTGGMGVVFKAYDTELHRTVAIKSLAPHLAGSSSARQRFAREARAAAAVVNDHVVPIHNVETDHANPYLVMQYIAGDSLQARLDREGSLELAEILRIGMQVATGLAAAHAQGLIHRDVKPSNILLDENVARALLTDFGLARTQDDACITRSGFQPGTPSYMSPEQVRGVELDGRSDLFGLGCVLYALSTGHPPFRADSGYAIMRRITDEMPRSICQQNSEIPAWFEKIVLRLLKKEPADRYQSAVELAQDLEQCLAHAQKPNSVELPKWLTSPPATKPSFGSGRRTALWLLAGMASLFAIFAGVLIVLESNKGTLTIKSDADDVPIRIRHGDTVVDELVVNRSGKTIRVVAGEYVVELEGDPSELVIEGSNVSLKSGESESIKIAYRKSTDQSDSSRQKRSSANAGKEKTPLPPETSLPEIQSKRVQVLKDKLEIVKQMFSKGLASRNQVLEAESQILDEQLAVAKDATSVPPEASLLEIQSKRIQALKEQLDLVKLMFSKGLASPDQVLGAELKLLEAQSAMTKDAKSLSAAINQLNQVHAEQLKSANSPALTEDEVVASLWWQFKQSDLSKELKDVVQEIALTRQLPYGWSLGLRLTKWDDVKFWENSEKTKSLEINLTHGHENMITIRRHYVASPLITSWTYRDESPLRSAIAKFNSQYSTSEPAITYDEVLAALSTIWEHYPDGSRNAHRLTEESFQSLLRLSHTHEIQDFAFEKLESQELADGDKFAVWSVRLTSPKRGHDGKTQSFEIRNRFIKVESDQIAARTEEPATPHTSKTPTPLLDSSKVKISTFDFDLSAAVDEFNQLHSEELHSSNVPPLTEDELTASLWWQYRQSKLREEVRDTVKEIVVTRKLPLGWSIKLNTRSWTWPQQSWHDKPLPSSAIQINLYGKEGLATTIRNQFVSSDTSLLQRPESAALEKAIKEFNQSHSEVKPGLTLDETLAALSTIWGKQSWYSSDLKPSTIDALLAAIDRDEMKGVTIELWRSYETEDGDRFSVSAIRLVVRSDQNGSTEAFTIRERFQKVNSFSDKTIHWGKPSEGGLQAGFRLVPSQSNYLPGQIVEVEFYYRSLHGHAISATVPSAVDFNKIITVGPEGERRETLQYRERLAVGWHAKQIVPEPTKFKSRKICFVATPEQQAELERTIDEMTVTVLIPTDGKYKLYFEVPDFEDRSGKTGPLATGSFEIQADRGKTNSALMPMQGKQLEGEEGGSKIKADNYEIMMDRVSIDSDVEAGILQIRGNKGSIDRTSTDIEQNTQQAETYRKLWQKSWPYPEEWQGAWVVAKATTNGLTRDEYIGQAVTISDGIMFLQSDIVGNNYHLTHLDRGSKPFQVDLSILNSGADRTVKTFQCLAELKDGQLLLVRPPNVHSPRPKSIVELGNGETLFVLRRAEGQERTTN